MDFFSFSKWQVTNNQWKMDDAECISCSKIISLCSLLHRRYPYLYLLHFAGLAIALLWLCVGNDWSFISTLYATTLLEIQTHSFSPIWTPNSWKHILIAVIVLLPFFLKGDSCRVSNNWISFALKIERLRIWVVVNSDPINDILQATNMDPLSFFG